MSYLKINNIKKKFNKVEILKGINIEIEQGELVCFLGPSGCGKTTLLRIIAGLETKDSGEIIRDNKEISTLAPSQRNIGIVFQNYALFPNLNVYENIAYGLINKKMPKAEIDKKVNNILKLVGLEGSNKKYPSEMSGGQQQRVALARAIVLEPEILLLDEPLSALDAKVRDSLREEIKSLQKKLNITTILVTHDQEEALTMGDKIVVFNEGKVMQVGTPEEIYYSPQNKFTADFVGKINFLGNNSDEIYYIRPECIRVYNTKKEETIKAIVTNLEFRGTIYRLTAELEDSLKTKIYVDLSYNERNKLDIKVGKEVYINISTKDLEKEKEAAVDEEK